MEKKNNKTTTKSRISRREFIGAAASVTAFTIVPRHVLGGPGNVAPSETLNIGAIGVGGHGAFLVNEIFTQSKGMPHDLGSVNFVALCDVDEQRASDTIARKVPSTIPFTGTIGGTSETEGLAIWAATYWTWRSGHWA